MLLGVDVDARDEDAVDALEGVESGTSRRAAPDRIAGPLVLRSREDQRHVQRHAGRYPGARAPGCGRRGGHLDHAIAVSGRPAGAERDIAGHPLVVGQATVRILEERIELEAHPAVVASRRLPDLPKHLLRTAHQVVGERPGDRVVVVAGGDALRDPAVEASGLDEVGNDDRVARGPGRARRPRLPDEVGIDRIEPEFRAAGDERGESGWHCDDSLECWQTGMGGVDRDDWEENFCWPGDSDVEEV